MWAQEWPGQIGAGTLAICCWGRASCWLLGGEPTTPGPSTIPGGDVAGLPVVARGLGGESSNRLWDMIVESMTR